METLIINIPEEKSTVVKLLLKELGVSIQKMSKARSLAQEIDNAVKPGRKPSIEDIVAETKSVRAKR